MIIFQEDYLEVKSLMSKALFMYYQRYAIVKKGFVSDSIDDSRYILELLSEINHNIRSYEQNFPEIHKTIERMRAQNMPFENAVDE